LSISPEITVTWAVIQTFIIIKIKTIILIITGNKNIMELFLPQ